MSLKSPRKDYRSKSVSYADVSIKPTVVKNQLVRTLSEPRSSLVIGNKNDQCQEKIDIENTRKKSIDTIGLHYYPEGGWGYAVCVGAFVVNFIVQGFIGTCGCFYYFMIQEFGNEYHMQAACVLGTYFGVFNLLSPLVVGLCRRKNTRAIAFIGGLILSLSFLFTSFASQFHQLYISIGLILPIGSSMTSVSSTYILGQYFKRKRELVEVFAQFGVGCGIVFLSVFYNCILSRVGWRLGLQILCGISTSTFIISALYRSASLYHPQRRAILHLKSLQKRSKQFRDKSTQRHQEKPNLFDLQATKSRSVKVLMATSSIASFGLYSSVVFLAIDIFNQQFQDYQRIYILLFLGIAYCIGSCSFAFFVHHKTTECTISRSYLCMISQLIMGLVLISYRTVLSDYNGKIIFSWVYGLFFGGYNYSFKMTALEKIRPRMFDRGLAVIHFANSLPNFLAIPTAVYLNQHFDGAGYYFVGSCLILSMVILFICELVENSNKKLLISKDSVNSSCRRCSDVMSSLYGPTSRRSSSSTNQTSGSGPQIQNQNDLMKNQSHKMDMVKRSELTCISEEGAIENLSEAYQYIGDCITSCDIAEDCLGFSEFENNWNQTCENIVMDQNQKMTRVRKKSMVKANEKIFDTCPDCHKIRPNIRLKTVMSESALSEVEEKSASE